MTALATWIFDTVGWNTFTFPTADGVLASTAGLKVGTLTTQTVPKKFWPSGKVKLSVVTCKAVATGNHDITVSTNPGGTLTPTWPTGYVDITDNADGLTYRATIPSYPATNIWLNGGQLNQSRVTVIPAHSGTPHGLLVVIFDIRVYSDGTGNIAVICLNPRDIITANVVTFTNVTIHVNGVDVYVRNTPGNQWWTSSWIKRFPIGSFVEAQTRPDFEPFFALGYLPEFISTLNNDTWDTSSNTDILDYGGCSFDMGSPGGRPDIGCLPYWAAQYLVHKTQNQRQYILQNGDLARSWDAVLTESDGVTPVTLGNHPFYWFDGRATPYQPNGPKNAVGANDGSGNFTRFGGNGIYHSHAPSYFLLPYLLTGDQCYLDMILAWAAAGSLSLQPNVDIQYYGQQWNRQGGEGLVFGAGMFMRGYAWTMRLMLAAYLAAPDSHPDAALYTDILQNNLNFMDTWSDLSPPGITFAPFHEREEDGTGWTAIQMWQAAYVGFVADWMRQAGLGPTTKILTRLCSAAAAWTTNGPAFPPEQCGRTGLKMAKRQPFPNGPVRLFLDDWNYIHEVNNKVSSENVEFADLPDFVNSNSLNGNYGPEFRILLKIGTRLGVARCAAGLSWLENYSPANILGDIQYRSGFGITARASTIENTDDLVVTPPDVPPVINVGNITISHTVAAVTI